MKLHTVHLSRSERSFLRAIIGRGIRPVRIIQRAQILLKVDQGLTDAVIATHLGCTGRHVANVRKRFCTEGVERALCDAPRSGRPTVFTDAHAQRIVAIACTDPPEDADRWTLELVREEAIRSGVVPSVSHQQVWRILCRHNLKPWRKKNVVRSEAHR